MRTLHDAVCLAVAFGSVAVAGWQSIAAQGDALPGTATALPAHAAPMPARRVEERLLPKLAPSAPAMAAVKTRSA